MYVVGIVHGKGGVGKSTIAVNLARALQLRGANPVLIDCDQQGTAQDWKASNPDGDDLPAVFAVAKPKSLSQNYSPVNNESDGQEPESSVVLGFLLPARTQLAHVVHPGDRTLDLPAPRRVDRLAYA